MELNPLRVDESSEGQTAQPNVNALVSRYLQPAITVLVPTMNESENIKKLLERLGKTLSNTPAEVIFVDDSTDETPDVIEQAAGEFNPLVVRLLHRSPEARTGGLGGAVVAGMKLANAPFVCVMDGDLQHPPELVAQMLSIAEVQQVDLVVASRRVAESDASGLSPMRTLISKILDLVARIFFPRQLHGVTDPLTGFFLVRLNQIDIDKLQPDGFKILMEILVRNPGLVKAELPFHFGERLAGKSKASGKEAIRYLNLLWRLRFGEKSLHFIEFALVGVSGILVNTGVLALFTDVFKIHYLISAIFATLGSTTWNFALSELWVFRRSRQPAGRLKRYALFFVMNNVALLLRSPIMYALTTWLGVYYLISNLISLAVLTILRYFLADSWIWGSPQKGADPIRETVL